MHLLRVETVEELTEFMNAPSELPAAKPYQWLSRRSLYVILACVVVLIVFAIFPHSLPGQIIEFALILFVLGAILFGCGWLMFYCLKAVWRLFADAKYRRQNDFANTMGMLIGITLSGTVGFYTSMALFSWIMHFWND